MTRGTGRRGGGDPDPWDAPSGYDPGTVKDPAEAGPRRKPAGKKKSPTKKTVRDIRRGKAANRYQVDIDGDDDDGQNDTFQPSGQTIVEALDAIDEENDTIDSIMEAARKKCQGPAGCDQGRAQAPDH